MWNVLPALPAALLGLGAAAGLRTPPRLVPWRRWFPLLAAVPALCAALAIVARVHTSGELSLVLPGWPASVFTPGPTLAADRVGGWCLMLLTLAATLVAVRATVPGVRSDLWARPFAAAAAAALLIAALRSPVGFILGWALLDATIFATAGRRRRSLLVGQVGLLCAMMGLATLPPGGFGAAAASSASGVAARPWLFIAAAIRMGVFPLWWAVPTARREHLWSSALFRIGSTLAGVCLLVEAAGIGAARAGILNGMALPLVAVVMGALLAVAAPRHGRAVDWSTTYLAGLVLVAASLGGGVGQSIALVLAAELALGRAAAYLVPIPQGTRAERAAHFGVLAALTGLPPTLGFVGRWLLYGELLARGMVWTVALVAGSTALALAGTHRLRRGAAAQRPPPLIRRPALPREEAPPAAPRIATAALLAVALEVILGLAFIRLAPLLGMGPTPLANPYLNLWQARSATALIGLGALLLPLPLAALLVRQLDRRSVAARPVGGGWDLTAAVDILAGQVIRAGALLERTSGLVEGRRAMAWTLLAVVGVALIPLAPPTAQAEASGLLLFATVTALGAALVLLPRPDITLVALGLTYVFVAVDLGFSGAPTVIPLIKLITGVCVVGILAISVLQAPANTRLAEAAARLAGLRGVAEPSPRLVPAIAVLSSAVLLFGVHSVVAANTLSDAVLRPALVLAAAGAITLVFARTPLRLSAGVFAILTAFELAYARLDPGLVVTGGLAVFQILFAIVASYFVGLGEERL